jgi:hypothetical protein
MISIFLGVRGGMSSPVIEFDVWYDQTKLHLRLRISYQDYKYVKDK